MCGFRGDTDATAHASALGETWANNLVGNDWMTIYLQDVLPVGNPRDYKVHFARHNGTDHPLDVWSRCRDEWRGWQEFRPGKNDFNRPRILALAQYYPEPDTWMFGGIFDVIERHPNRYEVEQVDLGSALEGRLKLHYVHRDRVTRARLENHFPGFVVKEVLPEPYSGRPCGWRSLLQLQQSCRV